MRFQNYVFCFVDDIYCYGSNGVEKEDLVHLILSSGIMYQLFS